MPNDFHTLHVLNVQFAPCMVLGPQVLQLENNRIEQLPENCGNLKTLIRLDVSTNNIRFLPASMGLLKKIQRIDCANNMLTRIPPAMGHLKTLKELNLRSDIHSRTEM